MTDENGWSEAKQRVNAELVRLDRDLGKHDERLTRVVSDLHGRVDGVKEEVSALVATTMTLKDKVDTLNRSVWVLIVAILGAAGTVLASSVWG